MWQSKPDRTVWERSADVKVHQFYEPLSPCKFTATHVLNGSCRQERMPFSEINGGERMGLRQLLWGTAANICLSSLSLSFLKTGCSASEGLELIKRYKTGTLHNVNYFIYSFLCKTQLPWPPSPNQNYQKHIHVTLNWCQKKTFLTLNI